jgi:hypothetical protein
LKPRKVEEGVYDVPAAKVHHLQLTLNQRIPAAQHAYADAADTVPKFAGPVVRLGPDGALQCMMCITVKQQPLAEIYAPITNP